MNVWHGCPRHQATAPTTTVALLPPCLPQGNAHPASPSSIVSPQIQALHSVVDGLMTSCASLEFRLDAIENCLTDLGGSRSYSGSNLDSLVEAKQVIISTVITLMGKTDKLALTLATFTNLFEASGGSPRPLSAGSKTHCRDDRK